MQLTEEVSIRVSSTQTMVNEKMSEEDNSEKTAEQEAVTPEAVLGIIQTGAQVYSEITANFIQEFVFYDRTLYEWASHLMVQIPRASDLDEATFRDLLIKLANNIQISSNYYSVASSMVEAIGGGNNIKKSDVVNAIVLNFQKRGAKRPAAAVIERMAESYLSSTVSAKIAATIVKNFWKQRMDTLTDLRKIMEQIGMSLHVEMKWTNQ
jgi:signal recognition particle GTPase